jgi:ribosomal protein L11 methyltransferase
VTVRLRFYGSLDNEDARCDSLWERGCIGLLQEGDHVVAFFKERVTVPFQGTWAEVAEVDYLEAYRRSLKPLRFGRIVVAPTYCSVRLEAHQKVLWLDPGMAFGTGHHETTRLALCALGSRDLVGRRVLDVGCGSGILAIAADLLGADESHGIDIDSTVVPVARENAARNASRAKFTAGQLSDQRAVAADTSFNVIIANLYAELHRALLADYFEVIEPGGILLLTGILTERSDLVLEALAERFFHRRTAMEGKWVLLEFEAKP